MKQVIFDLLYFTFVKKYFHFHDFIKVTIDMKSEFFPLEFDDNGAPTPQLKIENAESFYLRFDGTHRMWYTLDDPDDIPTPEVESDKFLENQVFKVKTLNLKIFNFRFIHSF